MADRLSSVAARVLVAVACVLALDVIVILYTGGYRAGHSIMLPVILLLAVVAVRLALGTGARSWRELASRPGILFSAILIVYLANGRVIPAGDTLAAHYLPLSVLREGNFDLDEFPFIHQSPFLQFELGHYVSSYPVGAVLLALPFYLPSALGGVDPRSPLIDELEKTSAATAVALSALVLFLALRRLTTGPSALVITAVYAFGTSSLSTSSQALWQHGASQLSLTAALYALVRGREDSRWVALAGFPLAFAVISRPTDAMVAVPLGLYVLAHHRKQALGFALAAVAPIVFQLWYNATYFGDFLRLQFFPTIRAVFRQWSRGRGLWHTPFWTGLAGILVSPGRGLFVYTPIALLSVIGLGMAWRKDGDRLLRYVTVGVGLTIVLYSKWFIWWGGHCYGPRLLADLTPWLALSLYPVIAQWSAGRAFRVVFAVLAAWSIGAHAIGAFVDDGSWNQRADVDRTPALLWSWTDNQLVNPLRAALRAPQPSSR